MIEADEAGQHALEAALDWTKVSTGLATGALVFGVGLLTGAQSVQAVHTILILSWISFGLSVLLGIIAQASIPVMMRDRIYNLEHRPFTWPARVHQVTFLVGIFLLLLSLIRLLNSEPPRESLRVRTAVEANDIARTLLPAGFAIGELRTTELLPGTRGDSAGARVWHIQFCGTATERHSTHWRVFDVLIDAGSGKAILAQLP